MAPSACDLARSSWAARGQDSHKQRLLTSAEGPISVGSTAAAGRGDVPLPAFRGSGPGWLGPALTALVVLKRRGARRNLDSRNLDSTIARKWRKMLL